jgi:hypothetical protein
VLPFFPSPVAQKAHAHHAPHRTSDKKAAAAAAFPEKTKRNNELARQRERSAPLPIEASGIEPCIDSPTKAGSETTLSREKYQQKYQLPPPAAHRRITERHPMPSLTHPQAVALQQFAGMEADAATFVPAYLQLLHQQLDANSSGATRALAAHLKATPSAVEHMREISRLINLNSQKA